jgi:hypothetical protein
LELDEGFKNWYPIFTAIPIFIAIENDHRNSGFSHEKW